MISTTTLKNAAFAIEHDLFTDPDGCNYLVKDGAILRRWEPATDDGDSFRLMAALNMEAVSFRGLESVYAEDLDAEHRKECEWSDDRARDYRTAIILCAASIGAAINRSPENH
jgi:hypothetical protein